MTRAVGYSCDWGGTCSYQVACAWGVRWACVGLRVACTWTGFHQLCFGGGFMCRVVSCAAWWVVACGVHRAPAAVDTSWQDSGLAVALRRSACYLVWFCACVYMCWPVFSSALHATAKARCDCVHKMLHVGTAAWFGSVHLCAVIRVQQVTCACFPSSIPSSSSWCRY
jgi:hypothetical protein